MLGLLISPAPVPGEGLQGYLGRLSAQNALPCHELRRYYRKSPPPQEEMEAWPEGWHGVHHQLMLPAAKPMTVWNTRSRRYCPICLRADGIWQAAWELSLVTSCHAHNVQLVQVCHACGADLTWQCSDLLSCEACGSSITETDPVMDDHGRIWISDLLGRRLNAQKVRGISALESLCLSDLHHLALTIGARLSEAGQLKPMKVKDSDTLEACQRVALAAASLMIDWPFNFRRHLRERLRETELKGWRLPRRLGPIYTDVYKRLSPSSYDFVRDELERVVKTSWHGPINARNRRLSHVSKTEHHWIPIKQASSRHQIPVAMIRRLVKTGEVLAEKQQSPSGKTQTLIYEESLARRINDFQTTMNLEQLSQCWGLSEERVRKCAEAGLIKFVAGKPQTGEVWRFEAATRDAFRRAGAILPSYEAPPAGHTNLYNILRFQITPSELAPIILQKIRSGELAARGRTGPEEKIGEWLFCDDEIALLKRELSPRCHLSVQESAKLLRIKDQVAYQLVHLGLLASEAVNVNGVVAFGIYPESIEAFKARYCFGVELAKELGCSPRWLLARLRQQGIDPVGGPGVNDAECRQYVWQRTEELKKFLVGECVNGNGVEK